MKRTAILLVCLTVLTQCKKPQPEPQPQPEPYTPPTGSIVGNVKQYNQYGVQYTVGLNAVTVSLLNTSFSTVTDASGNYTISGVPAGMYTLATDKAGCPTYQIQQINFPGNGIMYRNTAATEKPTYTFNSAVVKDSLHLGGGNHKLAVSMNMSSNPNNTGMLLVYGTNPNVDIASSSTYSYVSYESIAPNSSNFTKLIMTSNLSSNTTYYIKIYPFGYHDGTMYADIGTTNSTKYVGYGTPLPTYSLTIP